MPPAKAKAEQENYDVLTVIDAIDRASGKEISLLKDIHRAVVSRRTSAPPDDARLAKSNAAMLKAILGRGASGNDDYSNKVTDKRIKKNENGRYLNDKGNQERERPGRENAKIKRKSAINHQETSRPARGQAQGSQYARWERDNQNQINDNRLHSSDRSVPLVSFENRKSREKETRNDRNSGVLNRKTGNNQQSDGERKRDANGRFTSKDKSEADAKKNQPDESKSLLKKISGFFSGKSAGGETATDIAGSAAGGGVLWSAGKEAMELSAGITEKVVSLNDWNKNRKAPGKAPGKEAPTSPVRFPDVPASTAANENKFNAPGKAGNINGNSSQKAYQARKGGNVISMVHDQNKTLIDNDKTIIDQLKDIEENTRHGKSGASGGGMAGKLLSGLGATAIGKTIGKRILAGLSAVLGGKAVAGLLKRAIGLGGGDGDGIGSGGFRSGAREKAKVKEKKGKQGLGKSLRGKAAKAAAVTAAGSTALLGAKSVLTGTDTVANDAKKPTEKTGGKPSGKGSEKGTATASHTTAEAEAAGGKSSGKAAEKGSAAATTIAETAEKKAGKLGIKSIAKGALRTVPILGTAVGVGMDAVEGYNDDDGQRKAFNVDDDKSVSDRQKAEYTAANVVNMGGLVSGGAGLIASGAGALGFDSLAKSMTFDTGDIAKSLDGGISSVADTFDNGLSSLKDFFSVGSDKQVSATNDGANKTADAVGELAKSLMSGAAAAVAAGTAGVPNGAGAAGVPSGGVDAPPGVGSPIKNAVGEDLNIGGKNAGARSFRNNNFGNIRYVGQSDAVLESPNAKGEQVFAKYDSPEEGLRGLANQLSSYGNGTSKAVGYQKLNNVRDIITKYAPANENNTEGYISTLSKNLGVKDNDALDLNNSDVMSKMIRQISVIEGGNPQVTDGFIKTAIGSQQENGKWKGEFNPETLEKINSHRAANGLSTIASTDQRANPERYSTADKLIDSAKNIAGKGWDKSTGALSTIRDMSDEKIGQLFGNVEGLHVRTPDKGLTLPAGDKLPAGLISAARQPEEIGVRAMAGDAGGGISAGGAISGADTPPTLPASHVGVGVSSSVPVSVTTPAPGSKDPHQSVDNESWMDKTAGVLKSVGSSSLDALGQAGKGALSSMGVDAENPMKWAAEQAGGGIQSIVSDLVSGTMQNTPLSFLSDTVSGALGSKSGQLTKEALTSFSASPPAPVTNLAASGVAPVTQPDKDSRSNNDRQTQLLERIAKAAESKDPKDSRGNPNVTSGTAQPAPRRDIPLSLSDPSLESLWD